MCTDKYIAICVCYSLIRVFCRAEVYKFDKIQFKKFPFMDCDFDMKSEISFPSPRYQWVSPIFNESFMF